MKGWPEKQDLMGDQKEVVKDAGHQVRRTATSNGIKDGFGGFPCTLPFRLCSISSPLPFSILGIAGTPPIPAASHAVTRTGEEA